MSAADSVRTPEVWVPQDRRALLDAYARELTTWNERVNLVSRSSVGTIRSYHIPHCLTIAWRQFPAGTRVVDWGTGGGLPALPLAIAFPKIQVVAVDSIAKKAAAVRMMARGLGLDNVDVWQGRAEAWDQTAPYFVSRATAPLLKLWKWSRRAMASEASSMGSSGDCSPPHQGGEPADAPHGIEQRPFWQPGLICLKGGDLTREIRQASKRADVKAWSLAEVWSGARPDEKYILHVQGKQRSR